MKVAAVNVQFVSVALLQIIDEDTDYDITVIGEAESQHDIEGWATTKYGPRARCVGADRGSYECT
eukprot:COSAG01_NODE_29573_length_634_cov_2.175701_1_plen_65_part_00